MRVIRLIAIEWRLVFAPASRTLLILMLIASLALPLTALTLTAREAKPLAIGAVSLVSDEPEHALLTTIQHEMTSLDVVTTVHLDTRSQAEARLNADDILLYIVFPNRFFHNALNAIQNEPLTVVFNPKRTTESELFARMTDEIQAVVIDVQASYFAYATAVRPFFADEATWTRHLDGMLFALLGRLLSYANMMPSFVAQRTDVLAHVVASLFVVITLFSGMLPLFFAHRDDELDLTTRITALGATPWLRLLTYVAVGAVLAALAVAPLWGVALSLFHLSFAPTALVAIFGLYTVQALFAAILAHTTTTRMTAPLGLAIVTFVHILAAGALYPGELLPRALVSVGRLLPASWVQARLVSTLAHTAPDQPLWPLGLTIGLFALGLAVATTATWRRAHAHTKVTP